MTKKSSRRRSSSRTGRDVGCFIGWAGEKGGNCEDCARQERPTSHLPNDTVAGKCFAFYLFGLYPLSFFLSFFDSFFPISFFFTLPTCISMCCIFAIDILGLHVSSPSIELLGRIDKSGPASAVIQTRIESNPADKGDAQTTSALTTSHNRI